MLTEYDLTAAERDAAALPVQPRRVDSYQYGLTPDQWETVDRLRGHVAALVAEVRRLRALLPPTVSVEAPRSVRPALEAIFPRVARFAPPGTTSA